MTNQNTASIFHRGRVVLFFALFVILLSACEKDVSVTPPDEPPPNGFILVDSDPQGAVIWLEDKNRRRVTPDSLTWLETGEYKFTLRKQYFKDTTFYHDVVEDEKVTAFVDYYANPSMYGKLECNSFPEGAEVVINDSATGLYTPVTIQKIIPGEYKLSYLAEDHRSKSKVVSVTSSTTTDTTFLALVDTTVWKDYTVALGNISTNKISALHIDEVGDIHIGTFGQGYLIYNGSTYRQYRALDSQVPSDSITCITKGLFDAIWLGTPEGTYATYNGAEGTRWWSNMKDVPQAPLHFYSDRITSIVYSTLTERHFIGTERGVVRLYYAPDLGISWARFDASNSPIGGPWHVTSMAITRNGSKYFGLKNTGLAAQPLHEGWLHYRWYDSGIHSDDVKSLYPAADGGLLIGIEPGQGTDGAFQYLNNGSFTSFAQLADKQILKVFEDSRGRKWVGTKNGLSIVNPDGTSARYFTSSNTGLNLVNIRDFAEDAEGNIWIASDGGGLFVYKDKRVSP